MPPPSSIGDGLSDDDDDVSLETKPTTAAALARPPAKPAAPIVEAPRGIPQDLLDLFDFDKPRASTQPDVKAYVAKVLGKRRASAIASKATNVKDAKDENDEADDNASDVDEDGNPIQLTKSLQKLVDDELEDEKRRKKMRAAQREAKKIKADEKKSMAAIAEAMRGQQEEAQAVRDEIRAKAEEAAASVGGAAADHTPYPSAFVLALDDRAFGDAVPPRLAPACPVPTPKTLVPFENAAVCRARKSGGAPEDEKVAFAEALREALEGGFLATAFAAAVDAAKVRREKSRCAGVATDRLDFDPPCDAETARWLFETATRPESSPGVALGARDALLASAGYEPMGLDVRLPPRRRRGVFALPRVDAPSNTGDGETDVACESQSPMKGAADHPGAPPSAWSPGAEEFLKAFRRLGVRLGTADEPRGVAATNERREKATKNENCGTRTRGTIDEWRERGAGASSNAPADAASLSGRSAADALAAAALVRPPPGPMKPQVFATAQLLAMRCDRDGNAATGETAANGILSDPVAAAALLAALAALRLDPRAAALAHVVDGAAAALLAAASRATEGSKNSAEAEEAWETFASAAAEKLARVGSTHASRLAAARWLPWSSPREQRIQDLASVVALADIQDAVALLEERTRDFSSDDDEGAAAAPRGEAGKRSAADGANDATARDQSRTQTDLRKAAVLAVRGVVVDAATRPDVAWMLVSAIHHVDVVLHAGMADPTRPSEDGDIPGDVDEDAWQGRFMSFLKNVKARVPRSNVAGLSALKNLAVATYTRHQRAQRVRDIERD